MDQKIKEHLEQYLQDHHLTIFEFNVSLSKDKKFGDFNTNFCFLLAKILKQNPVFIAKEVIAYLLNHFANFYEKIEVVKPGFLNFFLQQKLDLQLIQTILTQGEKYPISHEKQPRVSIEYVSANPTGKLHLAHAYAAIFGTALVRILKQCNYEVNTEYYINDAGNQIDKLALSVLIRYLNLFDIEQVLFEESYHGMEIIDCAKALKAQYGDKFLQTKFNENQITNHEDNEQIKQFAKDFMLKQIKADLALINVTFDCWTSEKTLYESNQVKKILNQLQQTPYTYWKENALWLKTTVFGDDKDRVLIKSDGNLTYLVPDIALHVDKLNRGYDQYINIWGMDHHSYIQRLKIALQILGYKKTFDVICIQVMKLTKNGEEFKLSKRSGNSLTLSDLVEHIGADALKWISTSFQTSTHKNIDVDLILKKDNTNPLYYVEYAYTRIVNILNKVSQYTNLMSLSLDALNCNDKVIALVNTLSLYQNTLQEICKHKETQILTNYLFKLATKVHEFYNDIPVLKEANETLKSLYLNILKASSIVLKNGLNLLGIVAYEKM